jgi:hypothetical protein
MCRLLVTAVGPMSLALPGRSLRALGTSKILFYPFPKDKLTYGLNQIAAMIDQNYLGAADPLGPEGLRVIRAQSARNCASPKTWKTTVTAVLFEKARP